jgi:hypothetical protein
VTVGKPITLRGEAGAAKTILDAEEQGTVLRCTAPVTVRGLTIRGGRAPTGASGGGVEMHGGVLSECVVTDNLAGFVLGGGGISMSNGTVEDCVIAGNAAIVNTPGGGAILYRCRLIRSVVRSNYSSGEGGWGGGVSSQESTIRDCRFVGNSAGSWVSEGGAIRSSGDTIQGCVFVRNKARGLRSSPGRGGAVGGAPALISGCVFIGNESEGSIFGGAVSTRSADSRVEHCTFLRNSSGVENATVSHSIIAWCTSGPPCSGTTVVSCSDLYANPVGDDVCGNGTGNLSVDPEFCAVEPDVTEVVLLQADSPCAQAACGLMGAGVVGCESVSVERAPWSAVKRLWLGRESPGSSPSPRSP